MNQLSSSKNQALLFSCCFLVFGTFRVHHHELWSDETQPWLLARDSASYAELLFNKRYEGHPNFWYTALYPLTHLNFPVQSMQYLHLLFSTAVTYVFVRYAPFPILFRILFCLGYFPLFEYGTISRIYAPGLLCIFGINALFQVRYQYWLGFCTLLFLSAQTNFFGALFAGAIFLLTIYIYLDEKRNFKLKNSYANLSGRKLAFGWLIVIVGFALYFWSVQTPPDNYFAKGWQNNWFLYRFNETVFRVWEAFFPLPGTKVAFWNTNILINFKLKVFLSGLIVVIIFFTLIRNKRILILYTFLSFTLLAFFYFKYQGYLRHHGHLFIFYISSLWLLYTSGNPHQNSPFISDKLSEKITSFFLAVLLIIHLSVGVFATYIDFKYSFSGNKIIAEYVKQRGNNYLVVVEDDTFSSTISAYIGQKLYFPTERKFGSYFQFNEHIPYKITRNEMLDIAFRLGHKNKKNVVVVLYEKMNLKNKKFQVRQIMHTQPSISGDPGYFVYEIPYVPVTN